MPGKQEPTELRRIRPAGDSSRKGLSLFLGGRFRCGANPAFQGKRPSVTSGLPGQVVSEPTSITKKGIEETEVKNMKIEEIKQTVKTRYGKFAETGGHKGEC